MSTSGAVSGMVERRWPGLLEQLPTLPEAAASLLRTIIVAMFVLTFVMDPCMIPSPSMERTLMVGDFLLSNRQVFAPEGPVGHWILPYRVVQRGDVVVFYHDHPSLLVKRVAGLPGDRLRIVSGHVYIDGVEQNEPYARIEPGAQGVAGDDFPPSAYSDPEVDPAWWIRMQKLSRNGELTIPEGEYFVLGDNRDRSDDSRFWGFVPRQAIFAKPLVIYFSLRVPSPSDARTRADVKLEKENDFLAKLTGFARWNRIFRVVH
ncbi:MAG: signal peptidase I [Terracidiphilus sp.]